MGGNLRVCGDDSLFMADELPLPSTARWHAVLAAPVMVLCVSARQDRWL